MVGWCRGLVRRGRHRRPRWSPRGAGLVPVPSRQAALKVAYDHVANMHLSGRAHWTWAVNQVVELVIGNGYASEVVEQPLGALWGIDDQLGEPWSRTEDELAGIVRQACIEQVQQ